MRGRWFLLESKGLGQEKNPINLVFSFFFTHFAPFLGDFFSKDFSMVYGNMYGL